METTFPVMMESTDRVPRNEIGAPSMVVQQYARYPPALESSLRSASSLGSARSQADLNKSPALHRKETPRSLHSSPRGIRSAIPASAIRSGTSMSPPVFDVLRHPQMKDAADQAESRILPSREISDENIDDTYVQFIFYCNPNVPSSVDTSELRKTFRSPPRSDGKSFSVFTLFELIRKLDNKELKTWIQLAIELGVEPPSMEKKQSTQKVQQYAVRLKRWMRAMHVDAFFEYCLGHPHAYYTQLPPSGPFVSESRDGVPLEEDLALRALVPQWKPKRGRKRADEREIDEERAAKRPSLDTSSAIPFSAFPEDDPWITASGFPAAGQSDQQGQDLRWRLPDRETSPAGYPQSAILPRGHHTDIMMSAEPRSAVTPSSGDKARAKRKHGPAVSSAWPTSNNSSNGKSRGRPPNKPSSGSFSTFQIHSRESSQVPAQSTPQPQPQPLGVDHNHTNIMPTSSYNQTPTPIVQGRPGKLQLQVPQHMGAPVRLATPPTLLVNGVNGASIPHGPERHIPQNPDPLRHPTPNTHQHGIIGPQAPPLDAGPPKISFDDIIRALTNELLGARVMRPNPLSPDEAHGLAAMMVFNLSSQYAKLPMEQHPYLLAFHLGVGHHFGLAAPRPVPMTVHIDHFNPNAPDRTQHPKEPRYSISFDYNPTGNFSMQITVGNFNPPVAFPGPPQHGPPPLEPQRKAHENDEMTNLDIEDDDAEHPASEATWKQRFIKLRAQVQKKDRALSQYKRKIVESVMADI
ncbi:uncharacterized protein N7483_009768 [Penicillium malachiteum]|uniref:uncharacterized protein n=1 Tax=Penicillium malachiteum TaxID=1324776 RepID=UPI0025492327|nr:uncharacterized protein N7483_009768 [Penicillium malachiteum]KAJ5721834.1 hypothetical protein N7483_009768 [Penicillium malachiteum]